MLDRKSAAVVGILALLLLYVSCRVPWRLAASTAHEGKDGFSVAFELTPASSSPIQPNGNELNGRTGVRVVLVQQRHFVADPISVVVDINISPSSSRSMSISGSLLFNNRSGNLSHKFLDCRIAHQLDRSSLYSVYAQFAWISSEWSDNKRLFISIF